MRVRWGWGRSRTLCGITPLSLRLPRCFWYKAKAAMDSGTLASRPISYPVRAQPPLLKPSPPRTRPVSVAVLASVLTADSASTPAHRGATAAVEKSITTDMRFLIPVLAASLTACGTLAPGADRILVTRDAAQVAGCSSVGIVSADVNLLTSVAGDWNAEGWYKIRNQAAALHADKVLLTSSRMAPDSGTAYRCGKTP